MSDPWQSELTPTTAPAARPAERARYLRLMRYIKSKGMDVGLRPIFFVVDAHGKTPYVQDIPPEYATRLRTAAQALRVVENE
jgi:hypothetical protein